MKMLNIIYVKDSEGQAGPVWLVRDEAQYLSALSFAQLAGVWARVADISLEPTGTKMKTRLVSPEHVPEERR